MSELFISLAIIAILAILSVASVGRLSHRLNQSTCAGNLRQIGLATLNYANDHGGVLPGPMGAAQRSSYTRHKVTKEPIILVHFLFRYLQCPEPPASGSVLAVVFHCPAQKKLTRLEDDPVFYLHRETILPSGLRQRPFGYRSSSSATREPLKLMNVVEPSRTVALVDTSSSLPGTEIHGRVRNVLFLDGHVESIDAGEMEIDGSFITIR